MLLGLLFALALLPRLAGLGEATTEDEDQWIQRSGGFARGLALGAWRETFQIGHPGVTTMWVTTLGIGRDEVRHFATQERGQRLVTQVADFLPALHQARIPFAVLNAFLATACGLLAARLFGLGPGLLAGLLLAFDPYWAAMSPIVGMDGLLTGLMSVSLLSGLLAFRGAQGGRLWALASGLLAGLGLLTKGTAVFLLPMVPLIALRAWWAARRSADARWQAAGKLAMWTLGLAAAAIIWPSLWVDPLGTTRRTVEFVYDLGTAPHAPGNFFFGRPVADPGPLFYPVAIGLHLGPAAVLGLVALVWAALAGRRSAAWKLTGAGPLLDYLVIFGLGLTLASKKIDRYTLPLLPILDILAALGWWLALRWALERWGPSTGAGAIAASGRQPRSGPISRLLVPPIAALALIVGLLQAWPLLQAGSHPLSAYNPLFGGGRGAELAIPVGWGDGLDVVGNYLTQQPGADRLVTAIWFPLYVNFQAHAPGRVVNISFSAPGQVANQQLLDQADFYVDYIHARQRRLTPRFLLDREPDLVVTRGGVEYARVYRLK